MAGRGWQHLRDVDLIQAIEDLLQALGIGTGANAVIQGLEGDASLRKLAFGILVAVQTDPRRVGKVGGELDEQGAEVRIHDVEVVLVAHHRGTVQPGKGRARVR